MKENEQESEKRETVEDIVAEMRRGTKLPGFWRSCDLNKILEYHADRIEAAWKREKERAVEHATRHAAAAMREALEGMCKASQDVFRSFARETFAGERRLDSLGVAFDKAKAALSAPSRNCDVGTAEEQSDRFANLCDSHSGCSQCPVKSLWNFANGHKPSCGVLWAQMPYEAEEGGAK